MIPSTIPEEKVASFGQQVPMGRAAQPAELAPVYVLLASDEASYVSGARVAVTGLTVDDEFGRRLASTFLAVAAPRACVEG